MSRLLTNIVTCALNASAAKPAESYPLLRDAYAIIDGIPDARFKLSRWRIGGHSEHDCGTIACAAGWLAMHPDMCAAGLKASAHGAPKWNGVTGYDALSLFFGIDFDDAVSLFGPRKTIFTPDNEMKFEPNESHCVSDHDLWLARVRNFLKAKG